jgi:murein DD-endopeptidase MepM/ murein hydrolase activator NlpD
MEITFKNLESTQALPLITVLTAKQRKKVTRLNPIEGSATYRFRYHYQVDMLPGKAKAIPDKDYAYALPYRPGTAYWVVQGYGGKFTHQGRSRYSIDFAMPEGTPIYAAREGVVAETRMDSDESGTTEEYRELANYIIIEHPDGTWAEYYHLKENGVEVKVDEKVQTGQLIGYSGNTGYSKIPHLHFAIRKTISGKVSSTIPVKFNTSQGILSRLKPNRRYRAADPSVE